MKLSRRDLAALVPALAAAGARGALWAQQAPVKKLPSKVYHSRQIPFDGDDKKKGRQFFDGAEHSGFRVEMHETTLGAGTQTHDPHKHEHDEVVILVEGTVEAYIEGRTETAETGCVLFFASNEMHSVRNVGTGPCTYYVVELRGKEA
jgi:quercetin dioxygenase-like cupin family protein